MDFEKWTTTVQQAFANAQQVAAVRKHQEVDLPHLWKIFLQPYHFAYNFYKDLCVDVEDFNARVDMLLDRISVVEGGNVKYGQALSQNLFQLLTQSDKLKNEFGDEFLSTEIILLALYELQNYELTKFLVDFGLTKKKFKIAIEDMRGGDRVTSQNAEETYKALEKYGIDLVQRVREGSLDPIIGRDEEIRDVIRILSRKTKNNPVLIGDPGVGKTAIVE